MSELREDGFSYKVCQSLRELLGDRKNLVQNRQSKENNKQLVL